MRSDIQGLLVLQDRDLRLRSMREELERLPADEARARTKLDNDLAAVDTAKSRLQENEVATKKLELDVETRRTTITRLKQQQFETRKNDEYQALGHEITRYSGDIDELETRELELMEEADSLRDGLAKARAALEQTQRIVDEDLATIAERRKRLEQEIEEVTAERGRLAEAVDASLVNLYERLGKTKKGQVVSDIQDGKCGGCHVKLVPATLIKAQSENEITQCETCGRILYLA